MKPRAGIVVVAALALVAGITGTVAASQHRAPSERVYALSTVYAGLQRRPQVWVGRTVLVQGKVALVGRVYSSPNVGAFRVSLVLAPSTVSFPGRGTGPRYTGPQLQVSPHFASNPLEDFVVWLRGVPLVAPLVSERWGQVGRQEVFRLTLQPRHTCPPGLCADRPDALLDDVYS